MLTKTIGKIVDGIRDELQVYSEEIENAMAKNEGKVAISCSIKIDGQPHVTGAVNKIVTTILWVKDKCKIVIEDTVNEGQAEMEFERKGPRAIKTKEEEKSPS